MKKLFISILILFIAFTFCKKSGTDSNTNTEDKVTVEIYVTENGEPKSAIYVEVTATVAAYVWDEASPEYNSERLPVSETEEKVTNQYGLATYTYNDKSLADGTIVVTNVKLYRLGSVIIEDSDAKTVNKNTTVRYSYEIGGN
ncbi:hypothetical protein ACFL4T_00860 [candidate division KSB1 bacterium]